MKQEDNNQPNGLDPKINAIKEIIFGNEIQDYNQQFQDISKALEKQKDEFKNEILELKKELNDTIQNFEKELSKAENRLNSLIEKEANLLQDKKVDRKALAKMFGTISDKLAG